MQATVPERGRRSRTAGGGGRLPKKWFDTWSYGQDYGSAPGGGSWDIRYVAIAGTGAYHFPIENNPRLDRRAPTVALSPSRLRP